MLVAPAIAMASRGMRGFTMIEVLVTLVIMMFGLLGIAGLILKGHKASSEAYQRNQAYLIAADMAERIKTNRLAAPIGQLNAAPYVAGGALLGAALQAVPTTCTAGSCIPTATVAYDLATWNNLLVGSQETTSAGANNVGGILNARGCIEQAGGAGTPVRVSVAWQGDQATVVPSTSTCGTGLYGADVYRRVVSIDIL